ncbi:MAG: sugar phosphate isomerase/epimerase family protein [Chitinophagaceae bacterium]
MKSRRNFLKTASLTLGASGLFPFVNTASPISGDAAKESGKMLEMGMAGYTFNQFSIEQTISMMNRVGVTMLSLKEFHLPLNSTQEKANEVIAAFKMGGITIYAVGVIYMKDKAEVDRAFEYAKKVNVTLIIGVPEYELLPYTEEKVKATGIRIAIHNHGPEDKRYPGPKDVYDRIKNMDPKMGLCLDIGHAIRAGADPAKAVVDYNQRMFDLHIKDVSKAAQDGKAIELGRGVIDLPALVKALRKINYAGKSSIEFEKDMKDPLPGIAESVGFYRGVMKST